MNLRADCKKCFGLCCIAFHFSTTDGFPMDKKIGDNTTKLPIFLDHPVHWGNNDVVLCTTWSNGS